MRHHDSIPCLTPLWRTQGLGGAADPDDAPVARAAAVLPLAAKDEVKAGAGCGTEPGARADEEGLLLLPRAPPERRGTRVSARAGAGPLTLRLSELGLAELPRLTALAGAQLAPAPPAAPRAAASTEAAAAEPAALDGAPFVIENLCPVALEFGQEGTSEAVALAPGARAAYRWRAHPALLPRAARLLRLRGCAGQRAAAAGARAGGSAAAAPPGPEEAPAGPEGAPAHAGWSAGFDAATRGACSVAAAWPGGLSAQVAVTVAKVGQQWRVTLQPGVRVTNATGAPVTLLLSAPLGAPATALPAHPRAFATAAESAAAGSGGGAPAVATEALLELGSAQGAAGAASCDLMAYERRAPGAAAAAPSTLRLWLGGGGGWSLPVALRRGAAPQALRAGGLGSDVPVLRPAERRARRGAIVCVPGEAPPAAGRAGGAGALEPAAGSGQLELRLMPPLLLANALPCRLAWRLGAPDDGARVACSPAPSFPADRACHRVGACICRCMAK